MEKGGVVGYYKNGDHIQWFGVEFDHGPDERMLKKVFERIAEQLSFYTSDPDDG